MTVYAPQTRQQLPAHLRPRPMGERVLGRAEPVTMVRIWSNEHGMWWKPEGCGYTTVLELAGRYTLEAAQEILRGCLMGGLIQREGMTVPCEHLVPVPLSGYGS